MGIEMVLVDVSALEAFGKNVLTQLHVPENHAAKTASILVSDNQWGIHSHGIRLLDRYAINVDEGEINLQPNIDLRQNGGDIIVDADYALGPSFADAMMMHTIEQARVHGVATTTVVHAHHFAAGFHYVRMAAANNCYAEANTTAGVIAPALGGKDRIMGANSMAFGYPINLDGTTAYVVADFATTPTAMNKLRMYQDSGEPIPQGVLLTADGEPTMDPQHLADGMMSFEGYGPFGRHKFYTLSMRVDALAIASGGPPAKDIPVKGHGGTAYPVTWEFTVHDWGGKAKLQGKRVEDLLMEQGDHIKAVLQSGTEVQYPGQREAALAEKQKERVSIPNGDYNLLVALGERLDVTMPEIITQ